MKKINCGGFYINEDNFEITDDGELKLKSGGGSGGEGPLLVNIVYEDPALGGGTGPWLDATSLAIFAAAQTRGVIVYEHFDEDADMPGVDSYSPLTAAVRLETNGTVTYQFTCLVETAATNFTGAADAYPKRGNG